MGARGRRSSWDGWYGTARWARIRRYQLLEHPPCKYCLERAIVTPATICDHVEPHHGDVNKFWLGPFQSLCKSCHDSAKRSIELHGSSRYWARWVAARSETSDVSDAVRAFGRNP